MGRAVRLAAALLVIGSVVATSTAHAQITASDQLSAREVSHGTSRMYAAEPGLRDTIEVASFNACVCLGYAAAKADAQRLLTDPDLDVIGWQEANAHPDAYGAAPGWATVHDMRTSVKAHELAVSWRTSELELVDHRYIRMHLGSSVTRGTSSRFPPRFVLEVRLRSLRWPEDVLTVYDTHSNQHVERRRAPGTPYANLNADRARVHLRTLGGLLRARAEDPARSRWAVVLGDLNWDFRADQRTLRPGFVEAQVGEWAVSGWESMGVADTAYSHPRSRRRIDYVFLTNDSEAHFQRQSVRRGFHSDHRPVVATVGLD